MQRPFRLVVGIALFFLVVFPLQAQVPLLINYQGRLVDGGGLVNGDVNMSLRLFAGKLGGSAVYEDATVVTVVDGFYSTFLGDDTVSGSLLDALSDNNEVWVEVEVEGVVLEPRERLAAVAYAIMAASVPEGAITTRMLDTEAVEEKKLADDAVTGRKIRDGTIEFVDIGQNGADPGQVMKWEGTGWAPADDEDTGVTDHGQLSGLSGDDHTQYYRIDGIRKLAGDMNASNNRIVNLGAGSAPDEAVRYDQAVKVGDVAKGGLSGTYPDPSINDGSGSGLDADLLDKISSAGFLRSDAADVFNEAGAGIDLRFESNAEPNLLFLDGSADAVGIGTSAPSATLDVEGSARVAGPMTVGAGGTAFAEILEITGTTSTTGRTYISYPTGYSEANTIILSASVHGTLDVPAGDLHFKDYVGTQGTGGTIQCFEMSRAYDPYEIILDHEQFAGKEMSYSIVLMKKP